MAVVAADENSTSGVELELVKIQRYRMNLP
jgi:hypothetical protein